MTYKNAVPVVASSDVLASLSYYVDVLGFTKHFVFGNPPVYAGVERDGALIYISQDDALVQLLRDNQRHPDIFIWVADVDQAYAEHRAKGARIVEEISNRPWDARQYVVEDPGGYYLKIAQPTDEIAP
ncbi:MAG: VOC family protein [bacterium]|nr:VOC family protein [bacterium]